MNFRSANRHKIQKNPLKCSVPADSFYTVLLTVVNTIPVSFEEYYAKVHPMGPYSSHLDNVKNMESPSLLLKFCYLWFLEQRKNIVL
jgi:hypothetical protein